MKSTGARSSNELQWLKIRLSGELTSISNIVHGISYYTHCCFYLPAERVLVDITRPNIGRLDYDNGRTQVRLRGWTHKIHPRTHPRGLTMVCLLLGALKPPRYIDTVETLYNTVNFCWSTHKRHSIARPEGRGMGCLLWVQRATYCVDLSKLSSIKYLL